MFSFTTPNKIVLILITLILSIFTLQGPAEAATPKAGSLCKKIGQTLKSGSSQLECRSVANGKKVYFAVSKQVKDLPLQQSPEPFTTCRLPEQIKNKIDNWTAPLSIAYPSVKSTLNPLGSNNYLFFPIDFADAVGTGSPEKILKPEVAKINEWFSWYSNGKATMKIDYPKDWVRSSYRASDLITFRDPGNPGNPKDKLSDARLIEALLSDVEKIYDLSKYQGVYFMPSMSAKTLQHGVFLNNTFRTSKGTFTGGGYVYANTAFERDEFIWAFVMHDFLHSFGLALHAPDQQLPFGMQSSPTGGLGINEWDSMSLDWTLPEDVYCVSKENLNTADVTLVPIEREQEGVQSIMIKLSPSRVLVIESHRRDKWGTKFAPGFYGVTTFLVDTSVQNDPSKPDSETTRFANYLLNPATKHGKIVERRPWEEIDKNGVRTTGWVTQPTWDLNYVLYQGESFTTNGIKITLLKSGDNDTVRVTKVP
jgi:hypothetical protein